MSPQSPTTSPAEAAVAGTQPGPAQSALVESPEADTIHQSSGKELTESSAVALARMTPVRWIVIAGQVSSGKTTLLTSLFELFQWNKLDECSFAGSQTLVAFEERCHYSRLASDRSIPDTPRTPYSPEANFLHLRVLPSGAVPTPIDFLFTDVSGEMFEHARNSTDECKELIFLKRAATFVLVLDGEKAVRLDRRWAMVEEAKSLLKSCLDSSMLSEDCRVTVVWSKIDYFGNLGSDATFVEFRSEVESIFQKSFGHRLSHLAFAEISARPTKAPQLGFGKGLNELLRGWIADYSQNEPLALSPDAPVGERESELFASRQSPETSA
jgi:hypothetical protein